MLFLIQLKKYVVLSGLRERARLHLPDQRSCVFQSIGQNRAIATGRSQLRTASSRPRRLSRSDPALASEMPCPPVSNRVREISTPSKERRAPPYQRREPLAMVSLRAAPESAGEIPHHSASSGIPSLRAICRMGQAQRRSLLPSGDFKVRRRHRTTSASHNRKIWPDELSVA